MTDCYVADCKLAFPVPFTLRFFILIDVKVIGRSPTVSKLYYTPQMQARNTPKFYSSAFVSSSLELNNRRTLLMRLNILTVYAVNGIQQVLVDVQEFLPKSRELFPNQFAAVCVGDCEVGGCIARHH